MSKIYIIYYILVISATIVGCIKFKKLSVPFKLLTIVLLVTSITELVAYYLDTILQKPNTLPYHIFQAIEFVLVASVYKNCINNNKVKKFINSSLFVYPAAMLYFTVALQPLSTYPSYSLMLSYSSIFIFTLIWFYESFSSEVYPVKNIFFWFNTLYFLLSSVSICTLSLTNIFNLLSENNSIIYLSHLVINYIFYAGCLVLLMFEKEKK